MQPELATFSFPTQTLCGAGAVGQLPQLLQQLGVHRPLLVTDPGMLRTSAFTRVTQALSEAAPPPHWSTFSGVHPNPIEEDVIQAAATYREHGADSVIAIGGGSALDVGKAARLLIRRPELHLSDFDYREDWTGLPPFLAIPTTAGTGSEVGRSSVVTLRSTGRKSVLFHPALLAARVVLDPELTRELPPLLTAATGVDALTHCIESFTSPTFHPLCDGIALEGVHQIMHALPRVLADGNDLEARRLMLVSAAMGAIAFQKDLGAVHSMAHPLSTHCGMHHGTANALCLLAVMSFNAARKPGLYRRVGLACGLQVVDCPDNEADQATLAFLRTRLSEWGLGHGLGKHGVTPTHLPALAADALQDGCHRTNPVPVSRNDFIALYEASL